MAATTPEELLPSLKEELQNDCIASKEYNLIKFLNWKSDVKRAAGRYRGLQTWKSQNDFAFTNLLASQDESLKRVLESEVLVAPEGMVDKQGRAVLIGRLRNNDMSDGRSPRDVVRSFIYTIDRVLENPTAQQNGIIVFHDLTGLSPGNLDIRIPKMLFGALIGHFPMRVKGIYIYNAPGFFRAMFAVVSTIIIPAKMRQRVHFVNSMEEVYKVIDQEEMLEEHGGTRVHDTVAWVTEQMEREENGSVESLGDCTVVSSA